MMGVLVVKLNVVRVFVVIHFSRDGRWIYLIAVTVNIGSYYFITLFLNA